MELKITVLSTILLFLVPNAVAFRFRDLDFYVQVYNSEFLESSPFVLGGGVNSEDVPDGNEGQPVVQTQWQQSALYDYLTYQDKVWCSSAEAYELGDGLNPDGSKKSPLFVKCNPIEGNGTMHIITSLRHVFQGLAHFGNSTKRTEVGSCLLMLFYTKSCVYSAMVAPHYNALARHFPDLMVAAIDVYNFHYLNAEFGIVGLPTIMLFHQGRPLVKYNGTKITLPSLAKFVTRHTGIEPRLVNQKSSNTVLHYISDDFIGPLSNMAEHRTDYWLYVAWAFIIVCSCYYFSKSTLYAQIIEMIKRNWRESAAQHS